MQVIRVTVSCDYHVILASPILKAEHAHSRIIRKQNNHLKTTASTLLWLTPRHPQVNSSGKISHSPLAFANYRGRERKLSCQNSSRVTDDEPIVLLVQRLKVLISIPTWVYSTAYVHCKINKCLAVHYECWSDIWNNAVMHYIKCTGYKSFNICI